MGQKVHPNAFRLGVYRPWQARWFGGKEFKHLLLEDMRMRELILRRLRNASISKVETERSANQVTVIIWTAKPGIVIGKGGTSVDQLRDDLEKLSGKKVRVTIQEIKHPELDAMLVAQNVASQLERRIAFRRAVKQSVLRTMRAGAKGVKIAVSGRLGGAEMSRREWDRDGRVPLHTLKADIDFGQTEARTTFGRIGVSVWVYQGDFDTSGRADDGFEELPARVLLDEQRAPVAAAPTPVEAAVATLPEDGAVPATGGDAAAPAAAPAEAPAKPTRARAPRKAATVAPEATSPAPEAAAPAAGEPETEGASAAPAADTTAAEAAAPRTPAARPASPRKTAARKPAVAPPVTPAPAETTEESAPDA